MRFQHKYSEDRAFIHRALPETPDPGKIPAVGIGKPFSDLSSPPGIGNPPHIRPMEDARPPPVTPTDYSLGGSDEPKIFRRLAEELIQRDTGHLGRHGTLSGLDEDDHLHYVHINQARTITVRHTFDNGAVRPFNVSSGAAYVPNLDADKVDGQHAAAFASSSHTHVEADITDLLHFSPTDLDTDYGDETITALFTFDRDPGVPFAVSANSAVVPNLDADLLDGNHASAFLQHVLEDTTPEFGGEVNAGAHTIGFTLQTGTGGGDFSTTIDWTLGNKYRFTWGAGTETFVFTAPSNPCNLVLHMVQDATGGRDANWPASVKWLGPEPTWADGGAGKSIIVTFWYDGTNYWAQATPWES